MWAGILILLFLQLVILIAYWNWYHFRYWARRKVPFIPSDPFVGNVKNLLLYRCCFGEQFKQLYDHPRAQGQPYVGIHVLHNHALLLRDPLLIKRVLVRDFSAFASRFETADPIGDTMGSINLFFSKYEIWKDIHNLFSPLFSFKRVEKLYPLVRAVGLTLEQHMSKIALKAADGAPIVEVKEMCARFSTDIISSLAFGVEANSLENPEADFRKMCIEVNDPRPMRVIHLFIMFFFPRLAPVVGTHLFSSRFENFMRDTINYVIKERECSGEKRGDLIDIFINLKQQAPEAGKEVVRRPDFFVGQAAFLLLAGYDTSSSTIAFALYELAKQPNIQQRLRSEIKTALETDKGALNYETLQHLEYLGQVVDEVLRLYPPTSFLDRCCTKEQGYDLETDNGFRLPKGMPVYIPVLALHRDERFWPQPLMFDPDRFSSENRKHHTPMAYLPFGGGPRGCIGTQLGLLEVKAGLVHILQNYRVERCSKTVDEIRLHPKTFVLASEDGIHLRFVPDPLYDSKRSEN